jgi:hypothetical protein
MLIAVAGVPARETGAATGMLNATQQIGGSLGLSILTTVFASATRNEGRHQAAQFLAHGTPQQLAQFKRTGQLPAPYASDVLAHGISRAYEMGTVFGVIALLIALVVISPRRGRLPTAPAAAAPDTAAEPADPVAPAA